MAELTQEQRTDIAALALEATMQGLDLMCLLTALEAVERYHIIYPEDSDIRECDLCGGETGHFDDCPFAIIAKVKGDYDLPEPVDDGPALHAEFAQYRMATRLHDLLAPAPELLERAAEHCEWADASGPLGYRPRRDAAALRELAQALRAAMGEEE